MVKLEAVKLEMKSELIRSSSISPKEQAAAPGHGRFTSIPQGLTEEEEKNYEDMLDDDE